MPDFSMPSETEKSSSPKVVIDAVSMIPQGLVPGTIKAIDRLIGAAIDVPAAWLRQQTVKIEAKSQSLASVEAAVGQLAISELGSDGEVGERALSVLLRKEYRRQKGMLRTHPQRGCRGSGVGFCQGKCESRVAIR